MSAESFISACLMVLGVALFLPGLYLMSLGGSPYYACAGILVITASILYWYHRGESLCVYGVVIIGTVAWALWEVGLDGWALLPRLAGPVLLGCGLSLGRLRRGLLGRNTAWFPFLNLFVLLSLPIAVLFSVSKHDGSTSHALITPAFTEQDGEWHEYGRDKAGTRFSPLAQITPVNAASLRPLWIFDAGARAGIATTLEATALKIHDNVFVCTGDNQVISIDAETGTQVWRYDPKIDATGLFAATCRGVAYYRATMARATCQERIITATVDARLIALDLKDGKPCSDFGHEGTVDLNVGMGKVEPGYYHVTSAPQIIRDRAVLGGWVTDGQYVGEPSGVIRAFDAVSGALTWAWDIGHPDKHAEPSTTESYTRGTPNSWAPLSADERLGLVYLPTGNATPDYYGGHRSHFDERFSSSVIALNAMTGELRWSFQTTHHDLWDYDVSSQPTLLDLADGTPALLQATKRGQVFLLNRIDGTPIAAVDEKAVPTNGAPGERLAPTQPFSTGMPSLAGPYPSEARMWGVTPFDQLWCRIKYREARFDGSLTPLGTGEPTIVYPGYTGGSDWGGVSVDTDRRIMIANTNQIWNYDQLLTRSAADKLGLRPFSAASHGDVGGPAVQAGTPYAVSVKPFMSPLVIPCNQPPYGLLTAVDLRTRKVLWSKPLGTSKHSGPLNIPIPLALTLGAPNFGGSTVTRGGVMFIGATLDRQLRAIETATGRELWTADLPNGGQSTPMVYWSAKSHREVILIAAGGHYAMLSPKGDYFAAFALPTTPAQP